MDNDKKKFLRQMINIFVLALVSVIIIDIVELNYLKRVGNVSQYVYIALVAKIIVVFISFVVLVMCVLYLFNREINFDYMTGLYSRRKLFNDLNSLINSKKAFTVCYIDFNDFKYVNDNFGHAAGDILLNEFSERLRGLCPKKISGYRIGGDEFIILIRNTSNSKECIEKIWEITEKDVEVNHGVYSKISFAMGIVENDFKSTADELLKKADSYMYRNKQT